MTNLLRSWYDRLRGAGDHAITLPPMDGALRPNHAIDEAPEVLAWPAPDNIVAAAKDFWFSSGPDLLRASPGKKGAEVVASHETPVSALAHHGGTLAVGLAGGSVHLLGEPHDGKRFTAAGGAALNCPVALTFRDADTLLIGNGSAAHGPGEWRRDLLTRSATGTLWQLDLRSGKAETIATGLAWPRGIASVEGGGLLVSEAWRARLSLLRLGKAPEPVLADLPAYPGGIVAAPGGGYWLALFAPRRRLTELVMRESAFRERMMAEVEPEYWISPSLRPMESYYEPLQGGTLKKLAMLKPWAPSRSYGLVVRLGPDFSPLASFHSRADGTRHGISTCAVADGRLLLAATGGDAIVALDTGE